MQQPEVIEPGYHFQPKLEVDLPSDRLAAHEQSDLREFVGLLRRYVVLIVCVTVATALGTYVVSLEQPKQFTGQTTLLYSPTDSSADPTRAVNTIVGISTSNAVLGDVARSHKLTVAGLLGQVSISGDTSANLITISSQSENPQVSASLANEVAQALIAYGEAGQKRLLSAQIVSLQTQLQALAGRTNPSAVVAAADLRTQLAQTIAQRDVSRADLSVLSPAEPPSTASSPHPKRNAVIGLLAGLVLGVLLATLRERLDRRVRGIDEIQTLYHAPMLGMVPFMKGRRSRSMMLADFSGPGALADAYRTVRTNLSLFRMNSDGSTIIVVTSATSEEGKSAIAANVAHALSVMGKKVLAVSADLHNPSLYEYFEKSAGDVVIRAAQSRPLVKQSAGLVQVLSGEVPLARAVRDIPLTGAERVAGGSLELLADRTTFFDPAVLFSSGPMQAFLSQARRKYDIIVFDTPPLLANADASLLAQEADILVLAARLDHLTKNQARRAFSVMSAARLVPTGVIVTGSVDDEPEYGYGYRYRKDDKEPVVSLGEQSRTELKA